jgi:hypothetical protein
VLVPAGLFALAVVIGRAPPFSASIRDPMFFRRCLVAHVDLSLIIWSYAFIATLFALLPARTRSSSMRRHLGLGCAIGGVALVILGAGVPGARPLLANYLPAIDHPLFFTGLTTFAVGLVLTFLDRRLLPSHEGIDACVPLPCSARPGIRAVVVTVLVALVTLAFSAMMTPRGLAAETRSELIFWGAGHVLQVALEGAMLVTWLVLLAPVVGRDPLNRRTTSWLFGMLAAATFVAPLLALRGTTTGAYRDGFTVLMRWTIFPVTLAFLAALLPALRVLPREDADGLRALRVRAFVASVSLTLLGFVLGAMIRGSTTLVPAHYHAATGGVTVAFMATALVLVDALGAPLTLRLKRMAAWQPVLYGCGQFTFAIGFAVAGAHGMARKAYGAEQHVRTAGEYVGLVAMGVGGAIAVIAGALFLGIAIAAWRKRLTAESTRSLPWHTNVPSIRSKG